MIIRTAQFEDEERISKLIAQFRVELKELKGIKSSVNIEQAKEEFREYIIGYISCCREMVIF